MEQIAQCDDCNEDYNYNPKMRKAKRSSAMGDIVNPVDDEVKDLEQLKRTFQEFPIIPFYQDGDCTLAFFRKLKTLAPTHGAVVRNVKDFCIAGGFVVAKRKRKGFKGSDIVFDPDSSEHNEFIDFLEGVDIDCEKLLSEVEGGIDNYKTYGNAFIRCDLIEAGDVRKVVISNIDCEKCRYQLPFDGVNETILVSDKWTFDYLQEHAPDFVQTFPNWTDYRNGKRSSIIHVKNKVAGRDWYGEPDAIASLYSQTLEVQIGEYGVEGYANDFSGRTFFEFVADEEDNDDDFEENAEKVFTRRGQGRRLLFKRRLEGDAPTTVHEFKPNTEHEFHETMSNLSERQIVKAHNWHTVLMTSTQGSLGQGNEFATIYEIKYKTVIRPTQDKIVSPYDTFIQFAAEWLNDKRVQGKSLRLANLFESEEIEENV